MTLFTRLGWLFLLISPAPLLVEYFQSMWRYEEYHYFPVLFLAVGLLIFERWDRKLAKPDGTLAWGLIFLSIVLVAFATLIWSPWLALVGWLCACGSWFVTHHERGSTSSLATLWAPMWLLLRLPLQLDIWLTSNLQQQTSRLSSYVFDRVEVAHKRSGNVFELVHGQLFVEDACSGVQSLFALLFVATFLVVWQRRSLYLLPLYLFAGVVWAGVMNVVRVVAIGVAQESYGLDLVHGWRHELLGYACLAGAILLLLSTDRLIRVVFFQIPDDSLERVQNPAISMWNSAFATTPTAAPVTSEPTAVGMSRAQAVGLLVCSAALIVFQLIAHPIPIEADISKKSAIWNPPANLLEGFDRVSVGEHEVIRGGDDIALGDNSDVWIVATSGVTSRFAVSQPYNEFHDLCVCYVANGWTLNERKVVTDPREENWSYLHATFIREDGFEGDLFFSGLNRFGENINPVDASLLSRIMARAKSVFNRNRTTVDYNNLMVQLWSVSPTPLSASQIADLRALHIQSRNVVKSELKKEQVK